MTIANYSLIHWEDADPSTAGWLRITGAKEGPLTYCSPHKQTYFGGVSVYVPVWNTCHAVLR